MAISKKDKRRDEICAIIDDLGGTHVLGEKIGKTRQAVEMWYRQDNPAIPQKHWPVLMRMGVSLTDLAGIE